jgi:4'-phosphopantetheinyl transferase
MFDDLKKSLLRIKEPLLMGEAVWVGAMRIDTLFGREPFNEDSWLFSFLDTKEKQRAQKYRFLEDKLCFITGRFLSKTALASLVGLPPGCISFGYDSHGKPFVESPGQAKEFYFSISHSAGLVAVAVGYGRPVGIDVERYTRPVDIGAVSKRFLSSEESLAIKEAGDKKQEAFMRTWTLKEAYAKALGMGLGVPFKSFGLIVDSRSRIVWAPRPPDSDSWRFFQGTICENFCLGVCVQGHKSARLLMASIGDDGMKNIALPMSLALDGNSIADSGFPAGK